MNNMISEITGLIRLYMDNPSVPTYKFIRRSGVQCKMLNEPTLNELLCDRDITMAIVVAGNTPLFIGDTALYDNGVCLVPVKVETVSYPFEEIILQSTSIRYHLSPKLAKTKLKLKSDFEYPTIELCGENVKRFSRRESFLYPHKFVPIGSNDVFWADSMETIGKFNKYLKKVTESFVDASQPIFDV